MDQVYNIRKVDAYFGFIIKTKNSDYFISDKGLVSGNSHYFVKYPEKVNSTLKYIGSISKEIMFNLYDLYDSTYKKYSLPKLEPLKVGNWCIMGLQPEGKENLSDIELWMHTSDITDFHKQ